MLNLMLAAEGSALEIWWVSILLHMLNLIILVAFLTLLLYKPVKKFIKRRQESFQKTVDENKAAADEAAKLKEEYTALKETAKQEVAKSGEIAKAQVEEQKTQILAAAKKQADDILAVARAEAEKEKKRMENAVREDVASLATDIAGKIIKREIKPSDNSKIIDQCLDSWREHE